MVDDAWRAWARKNAGICKSLMSGRVEGDIRSSVYSRKEEESLIGIWWNYLANAVLRAYDFS
jgi:hypothetical protein